MDAAPPGRRRARLLAFALLSAGIAAAVLWMPPDRGGLPLCWLKWNLGVSCPGCGMTRSLASLGHGDLPGSVRYHLFGPALAAIATASWILLAWGLATGRDLFARIPDRWILRAVWGMLAGMVVYWAIRIVTGTAP